MSETTFQAHWNRLERRRHMQEILAGAILDRSLEVERARQAEIRRKIEEIQRVQHVRQMRVSLEIILLHGKVYLVNISPCLFRNSKKNDCNLIVLTCLRITVTKLCSVCIL